MVLDDKNGIGNEPYLFPITNIRFFNTELGMGRRSRKINSSNYLLIVALGEGYAVSDRFSQPVTHLDSFIATPAFEFFLKAPENQALTYCLFEFRYKPVPPTPDVFPSNGFRVVGFDESRLIDVVKLLIDEIASPSLLSNVVIDQLLNLIYSYHLNELKEVNKLTQFDSDYLSDLILKARYYIENHYHSKCSLEEIASYLEVSKSTLSRRFKDEMGISPHQYLANYRLEKAHDLLVHNNMSIQDIASSTGHRNPKHFSTQFSKKYGYSPQHIQKKGKL